MSTRRKLILSSISLATTLVCLTGTTFAWFSTNQATYTDSTDFNMASYDNLQISLDGKTYYSHITKDILKSYINEQVKDLTDSNGNKLTYDSLNYTGVTYGGLSSDGTPYMVKDGIKSVNKQEAFKIIQNYYNNNNIDELKSLGLTDNDINNLKNFASLTEDELNTNIIQKIEEYDQNGGLAYNENKLNKELTKETSAEKIKEINEELEVISNLEKFEDIISNSNLEYTHTLGTTEASVATSGDYLSFDLYFKRSVSGESTKNKLIKFYTEPNEKVDDVLSYYTSIKSKLNASDNITLVNSLNANGVNYKAGDTLEIDPVNSLRVGVYNYSDKNFTVFENTNDKDLGSAAVEGSTDLKHDKNQNAMYTYYNNLHPNMKFLTAAENNDTLTKTISKFDSVSLAEFDEQGIAHIKIYIWQEGWDSDYIIGLTKDSSEFSISLAFAMYDVE